MTKYTHLAALVIASVSLTTLSACSGDDAPGPATGGASAGVGGASAGTPGVGGASAGTPGVGGASAGTPGVGGASAGTPGTGGSVPAGGASAGSGGGSAGGATAGDIIQGKTAYSSNCSVCHGDKAQGGLGPNISGSVAAGIGSWNEAAFVKAVRDGIGLNGQMLCATMTRYSPTAMNDAQLKNVYAYLLSITTDTPNPGSSCP